MTENRPAFVPWLRWSFDRQTWPNKQLIIVDSSEPALDYAPAPELCVIRAPRGSLVGEKRNRALDAAQGDFIAWFDDDDWQHPDRLRRLVESAHDGVVAVGTTESWFLDVWEQSCAYYSAGSGLIFNSALFRTEAVRGIRFDETRLRATDTGWMRKIAAQFPDRSLSVPNFLASLWLCHADNLSNPSLRRKFDRSLSKLRVRIGTAGWLDTDDELERLRERIGRPCRPTARQIDARANTSTIPRIIGGWSRREPNAPTIRPKPLVSAVDANVAPVRPMMSQAEPSVDVAVSIKATILDAPYLGTMIPHMLTQAGVKFCDRTVVVDTRPEFLGKYQARPRGTRCELDRVLSRLLNEGVIDRVLEVPTHRSGIDAVMTRYFGAEGERVPTHATTGGPIFATLFGLESAASDFVVAMDADMFFHASNVSWVSEGLPFFDDPATWLVMTHAGPPLGNTRSLRGLGPRNAARAEWDSSRGAFRFKTASTRYFLADRRRLHGKLPVQWQGDAVLPLEQCISAGLRREGAARYCIEVEGSWDLHAHFHGDPFPEWAPAIASLVESGQVPKIQLGNYDLRLDKSSSRERWGEMIRAAQARRPAFTMPPQPSNDIAGGSISMYEPSRDHWPLAVVIAVRDRSGARVNNMLASLAWQRPRRAAEVIMVSLGSQPTIDSELEELCRRWQARLLRLGNPAEPWCKPLALNVGIRNTDAANQYLMTLDADMILAPNFLEVLLGELSTAPNRLVVCRASDLSRITVVPSSPRALLDTLPTLQRRTQLRGYHGCGGIQAARRDFFFDVRGYDEDLKWWGAEDGDMLERARRAGNAVAWIDDRTFMLHQWHPKRHAHLVDRDRRNEARAAWELNHRLVQERTSITRNPIQWGVTE